HRGVEIGGDDGSRSTKASREKTSRRATTRADVQAAPTLRHADRVEQTDAERIVKALQKLQAFSLELFGFESRKDVLGHNPTRVSGADGCVKRRDPRGRALRSAARETGDARPCLDSVMASTRRRVEVGAAGRAGAGTSLQRRSQLGTDGSGAQRACSLTTSAGGLSSRKPRKRACRSRSSSVHSANPICATSFGRVQWVPRGTGCASAN